MLTELVFFSCDSFLIPSTFVILYYIVFTDSCIDDDRNSDEGNAYFVLKGRCTCVQRLLVRLEKTALCRDRFVLVQNDDHDGNRPFENGGRDVRTVYVKMSELRAGSAFGLGEKPIEFGQRVVHFSER